MKRSNLEYIHQSLKNSRSSLTNAFLTQDPDIFYALYKFEKNPNLMNISMDRYFVTWLSNHWSIFQSTIDSEIPETDKDDIKNEFAVVFSELLSKWTLTKGEHQFTLGLEIISNIQNTLDGFIVAGINSDTNRNKLNTLLEKNRAIFDRQILKMENEL
jgi:hypothetical protein